MLKILLFAFGIVQIAHSTYAETNTYCAKGPSYWCQSLATSKECGAFKHCLQTVWSKHTSYLTIDRQLMDARDPNPNMCTNCLQCVDAKVNYCPYVHDFGDEIDIMRHYNLSTTSICKLLEQCKSSRDIITGSTDGDYQPDARFKCGLHPRQHCDDLETAHKCASFAACLRKWSQSNYQYVLSPLIGSSVEPSTPSEKTCGFCIFLFNKLHQILEQNETEIDIEQYLLGACSLLPTKEEAQMCNDSVQKYLPEIIQMLRNNLDPGIICRVLKLCDDKFLTPIKLDRPKPLTEQDVISEEEKIQMSKDMHDFLNSVKWRVVNPDEVVIEVIPLEKKQPHLLGTKDEMLVMTLKQSMGIGCELCEIVLSAAKHLIDNKVDDKKVLAFIDKELCSRLGSYKTACSDYINLEGEQILQLLRKAVDPALICEMMGFCLKAQLGKERLYDLNVRNALNCTLCKMVFAEVKKKLAQHDEETRIIEYIDTNLCEHVGKSKEVCKQIVDSYGPIFLQIIARDVSPQQMCELIGMCATAQADAAVPMVDIQPTAVDRNVKSNQTCVVCEFVIKLVSEYVNQNSTESEVEKVLDMVCNKVMPEPVRPQCNEFVSQYGPVIVSLIVNGIKPDQVCRYIGLCPKTSQFALDPAPSTLSKGHRFIDEEHLFKHRSQEIAREQQKHGDVAKVNNQTLECSLCIYVAELVDMQLKQNKTEEEITKEVELVCNLFPHDLKDQCKAFVDEYMPYIIQLVAAELEPEQTCAALKICSKSIEHDIFRRTFVNKLPTH